MTTKTKPVFVYWDSCVFIAAIQQETARYAVLEAIIADAKDGKVVIVASVLVRAEVAKLNQSTECLPDQVHRIAAFFENDFIELRDTTEAIAAEAASIHRAHNLKIMDALHVATAIHTPCRVFHTYDGTTRKPGRTKAYLLELDGKIGRPPLRIIQPQSPLVTLPLTY
jgi:predicted nucleic acid-binding protein